MRPVPLDSSYAERGHRFAICVPVRNEEVLLPRFLGSIAALNMDRCEPPELFIAFDSCADGSEKIVTEHVQAGFPFKVHRVTLSPLAVPNAGRARGAAMDAAVSDTSELAATHILTTDADSIVAPNWLQAHVTGFRHADVSAGLVRRTRTCENPRNTHFSPRDDLETYLERLHRFRRRIDPIQYDAHPSHPYASGASIGITREGYRMLEGLPRLPNGEDEALVRRARLHGLRVRQDCNVQVRTSDRRDGRATAGLAAALRSLDDDTRRREPILVEDPRNAAEYYRRQAASRSAFARIRSELDAWRHALRIEQDGADVVRAWRESTSADAFAMRIAPDTGPHSAIALAEASVILQTLETSPNVQYRQAACL